MERCRLELVSKLKAERAHNHEKLRHVAEDLVRLRIDYEDLRSREAEKCVRRFCLLLAFRSPCHTLLVLILNAPIYFCI